MSNGNFVSDPKGQSFWPNWRANRLFTLLLAILIGYAIVWLGSMIHLNLKKLERVGKGDSYPYTISIDGTGKATGSPDLAQATFGFFVVKPEVALAQAENTAKMNSFIAEVKKLGIEEKDIQTANYSVQPEYVWQNDGTNTISGYRVSQDVTIKIRDQKLVGQVISKAGEMGLNQISGPSFSMDNPEPLRAQARELALKAVKERAEMISQTLGVKLKKVSGYSESSVAPYLGYADYGKGSMGLGAGTVTSPEIQSGSYEETVQVYVSYEIE